MAEGKKPKVTLIAITALVALGTQQLVSFLMQPSTEDEILETVADMNRDLPQQIDVQTRLDSVSAGDGLSFTYHYTVSADAALQLSTAEDLATFKETISARAITTPDMRDLYRRGVTTGYSYSDPNGRLLIRFEVTPEMARVR